MFNAGIVSISFSSWCRINVCINVVEDLGVGLLVLAQSKRSIDQSQFTKSGDRG